MLTLCVRVRTKWVFPCLSWMVTLALLSCVERDANFPDRVSLKSALAENFGSSGSLRRVSSCSIFTLSD